ncbi:MAG: radical SAM protein [Fibromonadaceae bacterium]|jgi:pyruvate-formate lyase-activating enzyme|nr:radical SAM protein [Fibromonadaceae bacterium]
MKKLLKQIMYGAGQYARDNLSRWMKQGINPLCFADVDPQKFHTFIEGLEILPLDEALRLYPDAKICITVAQQNVKEIYNYLLNRGVGGVIDFPDDVFIGKSCSRLQSNYVNFFTDSLSACCMVLRPKISCSDNLRKDLISLNQLCKKIRDKLNTGEGTSCDGCPEIRDDIWLDSPTYHFDFATGFKGDLCNFRCSYCTYQQTLVKKLNVDISVLEIIEQLSDIIADTADVTICFANGETTINKDFDKTIEIILNRNWKLILDTNATVLPVNIERFANNILWILSSVDAGTAETFYKIKGVNCYDRVVKKLNSYHKLGVKCILKYILLPEINDNEDDILGFAELANSINASVIITSDSAKRHTRLSNRAIEVAKQLFSSCTEHGLRVMYSNDCFNEKDYALLKYEGGY